MVVVNVVNVNYKNCKNYIQHTKSFIRSKYRKAIILTERIRYIKQICTSLCINSLKLTGKMH